MLAVAMVARGLCVPRRDDAPWYWLVSWRASEIDALCKRIILQATPRTEHVFASILDRLPSDIRARVDSLLPNASATRQEKEQAHEAIYEVLQKHKHQVFQRSMRSPCLAHKGCVCPLAWQDPSGAPTRDRPLTMNVSGPVCLPWSQFGKSEGMGHESVPALHVWLAEMSVMKYDVVTMENSPRMPLHVFASEMSPSSEVVSLVFGPEDMGWPVMRRRLCASAIRRDSLVWVGPLEPAAVKSHFMSFFARRVAADGDVFSGIDDLDSISATRTAVAKRQHKHVENFNVHDAQVVDLYSGRKKARVEDYMGILATSGGGHLSGSLVCDVTQDPKKRPRQHPWIPTITRSTEAVLLKHGHPRGGHVFTQREMACAMGWPSVKTDAGQQYEKATLFDTYRLSANSQKLLQGNSMHLAAVTTWLAYVMCHTIRRDIVAEYSPDLRMLRDAVSNDVNETISARHVKDAESDRLDFDIRS